MFIKDMSCISPQATFYDNAFYDQVKAYDGNKLFAEEPDYKEFIPLGLLRRMSKLVTMSVATAMPLNDKHKDVDGIIIGSSNGSVEKSLRFLNQIMDYDEGTLSPTDFVQSTSNCVAGMLALMGKITGYNTTHVNQGLAFESCILDALLLFEEGQTKRILLGGGEELSEANHNIESQRNLFKEEDVNSLELLNTNTPGTLPGEGFTTFVMDQDKSTESIAEIVDVDMTSHIDEKGLLEKLAHFLKKNNLESKDIDAFIFGRNGDNRNDHFYDLLEKKTVGEDQAIYVYKHLTGEYYCASAFATWLGAKLAQNNKLPEAYHWKPGTKKVNNILIYNNHEGKQHGFVLMRNPKK